MDAQPEISPVPLAQVGLGTVGLELIELVENWNQSSNEGPKFKYVGLADSGGIAINKGGFPSRELEKIEEEKRAGGRLSNVSQASLIELSELESLFSDTEGGVLIDVTDAESLSQLYHRGFDCGWSVVVANKIPLTSVTTGEFRKLTEAGIRYEATVGAGLPVISTLKHLQRQGDRIEEIGAILSGSLSYILSEVDIGKDLSDAVLSAKQKGFTEPNPVEDLIGNDVVRKGLILGRSLGMEIKIEDVDVSPLVPIPEKNFSSRKLKEQLVKFDSEFRSKAKLAEEQGKRLRYLARVNEGGVKVGLESLDSESPLAGGAGTSNVIQFKTENYTDPPLIIQGPGAGPRVTAGGVLSEINSLTRG
ncbi:MAG: hypothetical protein ACOC6I_02485 [Candidatus Bipolaricaulota bacterium]